MLRLAVFVGLGLMFLIAPALAAPDETTNQLKSRIDKLENENTALRKELDDLKRQISPLLAIPNAAALAKSASESDKILQLGKDFFRDLEKSRTASSYRTTSAAYKKRVERKKFDEMVDKHAPLSSLAIESYRETKVRKLAKEKAYEFYCTAPVLSGQFLSGSVVNVTLRFIEEEGEWLVDDVEIAITKR